MASLANAAKAAGELHELSGRLHTELVEGCGDFARLVELADAVGDKGDVLAAAFHEADQILRALVRGDGSLAVEPARSDGLHADGGAPEVDDVVAELRDVLQRLAHVERHLGEGRRPDPKPVEAASDGEAWRPAAGAERENGDAPTPRAAQNGRDAHDRLTRAQLYNWAQEAEVPGRSRMSKGELLEALHRAA